MRYPRPIPAPADPHVLGPWFRRHRRAINGLLVTDVTSIFYDTEAHVGEVVLPAHYCTDFTGAITLFRLIDPDVIQVQVVSGDKLDIVYAKTAGGWIAGLPSEQ